MKNALSSEAVNKIKESIEADSTNKLYEELSKQNATYITIIGFMLTFILAIVGAYIWQQLKFSNNGIKRIEKKFEKEFKKAFKIEEKDKKIGELNSSLKEAQEMQKNLSDATKKMDKRMKDFKKDSVESMMTMYVDMIEMSKEDDLETLISNKIGDIRNMSAKIGNVKFSENNLQNSLIAINNGMQILLKRKFPEKGEKIKDNLKVIIEAFGRQVKMYPKNESIQKEFEELKNNIQKIKE